MIRRPPSSTLFPCTTLLRSPRSRPDASSRSAWRACSIASFSSTSVNARSSSFLARMTARQKRRAPGVYAGAGEGRDRTDRKSTRLNSSHQIIPYPVLCLKKQQWDDDHRRDDLRVDDDRQRDRIPILTAYLNRRLDDVAEHVTWQWVLLVAGAIQPKHGPI